MSTVTSETKSKSKKQRTTIGGGERIHKIPLEKLHNHPANPDPTEDEIREMCKWLIDHDQLEPITVRPAESVPADYGLPVGHYQVLAGKTRLAAAAMLGWDTLDARVRDDLENEAEAIELLAGTNQQRRTETPIRQALMIRAMIEAGRSVVEAGGMYGLESESAVRNKLQLLKLPPAWQQRVISGEMPESAARILVPYVEHAELMKLFDADYRETLNSEWAEDKIAWTQRDEVKTTVERIVGDNTRPIDEGTTYWLRSEPYGERARLFELDGGANEVALKIVELPTGKNGKLERRALNVSLYDQLQEPFLNKSNGKAKAKGKGEQKQAELTPAEEKRLARQRRAESDKKLAEAVKVWRYRFLRCLIADKIQGGQYSTGMLLPWIMQHVRKRRNEYATDPAPLDEYLEAAAALVAAENGRHEKYKSSGELVDLVDLIENERFDDEVSAVEDLQAMLLRILIWPQCESRPKRLEWILQTTPPPAWRKFSRTGPPTACCLVIEDHVVDTLVKVFDVSIADGWKRSATGGSRERAMALELLELHTRDQLNDLAAELLGAKSAEATQIADQKRRDEAIALLMDAHTSKRPLKLPSCLTVKAKAKRRGKK